MELEFKDKVTVVIPPVIVFVSEPLTACVLSSSEISRFVIFVTGAGDSVRLAIFSFNVSGAQHSISLSLYFVNAPLFEWVWWSRKTKRQNSLYSSDFNFQLLFFQTRGGLRSHPNLNAAGCIVITIEYDWFLIRACSTDSQNDRLHSVLNPERNSPTARVVIAVSPAAHRCRKPWI